MVARIAPSPIATAVAIGDAHTHTADHFSPAVPAGEPEPTEASLPPVQGQPLRADAPPLPAPTGQAFAVAVMAGQLPPRPVTPALLRQRLRAAVWQPPASPLRLTDRTA